MEVAREGVFRFVISEKGRTRQNYSRCSTESYRYQYQLRFEDLTRTSNYPKKDSVHELVICR